MGSQNELIPQLVQEQLWRNINRPWYVDSGCSKHMTWGISQLHDIQTFNRGYVSFAGAEGGKITQKGTVANDVLSFENVNFALELKHTLLSVSQICDKGFSTHFTNKECLILKLDIIILEDWILVRYDHEGNAYMIAMNHNIPEQVKWICGPLDHGLIEFWIIFRCVWKKLLVTSSL